MRLTIPGGRMVVGSVRHWLVVSAVGAGVLAPLRLLAAWMSRRNRSRMHRIHATMGRVALAALGVRLEVSGLENLDPNEAYVVAPLHEGFADVLPLLDLGLDLRFVALEELAEWPALGRHLQSTGQLLVPSGRPRAAYRKLVETTESLDDHESLVIFPQGTVLGIETGFQRGFLRIAERLDRRVLPIVISGTHKIWDYPFDRRLTFGCRVTVEVLPPLNPRDVDIATLQRRMKRTALAERTAEPRRFVPEIDGTWDGYHYTVDPDFDHLYEPSGSKMSAPAV